MDATAHSTYLINPSSEGPDSIRGNHIINTLLAYKAWTVRNLIYFPYTYHYISSCCSRSIRFTYQVLNMEMVKLKDIYVAEQLRVATGGLLVLLVSESRGYKISSWIYSPNNHHPGEKNINEISAYNVWNIYSSLINIPSLIPPQRYCLSGVVGDAGKSGWGKMSAL